MDHGRYLKDMLVRSWHPQRHAAVRSDWRGPKIDGCFYSTDADAKHSWLFEVVLRHCIEKDAAVLGRLSAPGTWSSSAETARQRKCVSRLDVSCDAEVQHSNHKAKQPRSSDREIMLGGGWSGGCLDLVRVHRAVAFRGGGLLVSFLELAGHLRIFRPHGDHGAGPALVVAAECPLHWSSR